MGTVQFYSVFFSPGEEGRKNDELRHEVQASLEIIEDLLYVNESEDEEEDPEQIDVAYRNALGLAIRRFEIMKLLGFKAICQIEACRKVVEFSIDVPDENVRKKYLHIGLELHRILYGSASHYYTDWKKKVVSAEDGTAVKQSKHSLDR